MSGSTALPLRVGQDEGFPSAAALRAAHSALLRRERAESVLPEFSAEVLAFIQRGRVTGKVLDDDSERRLCQSMLDYWTTVLYRSDDSEPIDSTLDLFDPELAPLLPNEPSPYVGLRAFDAASRERFFGRREQINALVYLLQTERFLAVVGPSGSGKSSLVLGGLRPALQAGAIANSQHWCFFLPFVPGSTPLSSLARALRPPKAALGDWVQRLTNGMLADSHYLAKVVGALTSQPALLIVDQFEELFTLGARPPVINAFAANLLGLVSGAGTRHTVVVTMRSDFEDKIALLPDLKPRFERAQVRVTPMGAPELREAIEEPARQVGLKIEPRVVDALINDILGYDAALPLLQFTLLRLWELRDHNRVTWDIYQQTGGGKEALERSAEAFYGKLAPELQRTMRRILLRMVRPRAGLEFTSKRVRLTELYQGSESADRITHVLGAMLDARLLRRTEADTPTDTQIEVAHEALVRNWHRLVDWLEVERARLREQQRLVATAESWKTHSEDPNVLLRGVVLDEALRLPLDELGANERAFLRASLRARIADEEAKHAAEQAQEQALRRELAQAHTLAKSERAHAAEQLRRAEAERARAAEAERRQTEERARAEAERLRAAEKSRSAWRLRRIALTLAVVLAFAVVTALYAYLKSVEAETARTLSVTAKNNEAAARQTAEANAQARGTAQANAIAAQQVAEANAETAAAAEQAALIAAEKARSAANLLATAVVNSNDARAAAEAQSQANATEVAIRSTAQAQAQGAQQLAQQQAAELGAAQATADAARQTAQALQNVAEDKRDQAKAFALRDKARLESDRARRLQLMLPALALSTDRSVVEDFHTALQLNHLPVRTNSPNVCMAWSPTGDRMAIGSGNQLELWNAPATTAGLRDKQTFAKPTTAITSLAWSPNGASIAVGYDDGAIQIWSPDAEPSLQTSLRGHKNTVTGVAWSPDSQQLISASTDGTLRLWALATSTATVFVAKQNETVSWAAWSNRARQLVSSAGNTIVIRNVDTGAITKELNENTGTINSVAWSPDGSRILSASADGAARIWDIASGVTSKVFKAGSPINSAFWSPDGERIATASDDAMVRIWAVGNAAVPILTLQSGENARLTVALWNPDGWRLAVAAADGTLREFWIQNEAINTDQMLSLGEQLLRAQAVPTLAPGEVDRMLANPPTAVPAATITITPSPPTHTPTPITPATPTLP